MNLIFKRADTSRSWPPIGSDAELHSLTYRFPGHPDAGSEHPDDDEAVLDAVRQLHDMMFRAEELIGRAAQTLRRRLTEDLLPSAGRIRLIRWTLKARQELTPTQWYVGRLNDVVIDPTGESPFKFGWPAATAVQVASGPARLIKSSYEQSICNSPSAVMM